jgi:hypothetical protein
MTGATAAVLVGTITDLVGHRRPPDVVTTVGDRTLTTATVVAGITMHSAENGHALQTDTGDTDMMHIGVGAQVPTAGRGRRAIALTSLAATEMTCPTSRSS